MRRPFVAAISAFVVSSVVMFTAQAQRPVAHAGVIETIAGGGRASHAPISAFLPSPTSVVLDHGGDVYIAAAGINQVYKLDPLGHLTLVAGNGVAAYSGDGGPATAASMLLTGAFTEVAPAIALDAAGNLYVADEGNSVIRRVDALTGIITTVAGNGTAGYSGDGGPAVQAELANPYGLAFDAAGNLYICDASNAVVRRLQTATGVISTYAGNGVFGDSGDGGPATSAELAPNGGLDVDAAGNLYIADTFNDAIRVVSPAGTISTVPGAGNINSPTAVRADNAGHLYISDAFAVLRLDLSSGATTVAAGQEGVAAFSGDGGPATAAALNLSGAFLPSSASLALDASGNLYIPDSYNNRVRVVNASTGIISTLAGGGSGGDGGPASRAVLGFAVSSGLDAQGNFRFDESDGRVRQIDARDGIITTIAGNGSAALAPPTQGNQPAVTATLAQADFIGNDGLGNLLIADSYNDRVWRVDSTTGTLTLLAGAYHTPNSPCPPATLGDGGPATSACLNWPRGVAADAAGNLYIVDSHNYRIRKVDAVTGVISTIAGTGPAPCSGDGGLALAAGLGNTGSSSPVDIALNPAGDILFGNCQSVRRIDAATGLISTVAGNGGTVFNGESGPATAIATGAARDIAYDSQGNVFFAEPFFNRIRRLDAFTGILSTIAGSGSPADGGGGYSGDGGLATAATLNVPYGMTLSPDGRLLIADSGNYRIRAVTLPPFAGILPGALDFGAQPAGSRTSQTITVKSTGVAPLRLDSPHVDGANDAFHVTASTCGGTLSPGETCTITVEYRPHHAGADAATLNLGSDAVFSPQSVPLIGTATSRR